MLQLNVAPEQNPMHPSLSQGPIKWNEFAEIMKNTTNLKISLKSKTNVENAVQDLTTSIQSAIYKSSYPYTPRSINQKNDQTLFIYIRTLIFDKRHARSKWQKYRYPSDKKIFNHLTNTIKKLISKHKIEYFEKKYQTLKTNDGFLWKTTNLVPTDPWLFLIKKKQTFWVKISLTFSNHILIYILALNTLKKRFISK